MDFVVWDYREVVTPVLDLTARSDLVAQTDQRVQVEAPVEMEVETSLEDACLLPMMMMQTAPSGPDMALTAASLATTTSTLWMTPRDPMARTELMVLVEIHLDLPAVSPQDLVEMILPEVTVVKVPVEVLGIAHEDQDTDQMEASLAITTTLPSMIRNDPTDQDPVEEGPVEEDPVAVQARVENQDPMVELAQMDPVVQVAHKVPEALAVQVDTSDCSHREDAADETVEAAPCALVSNRSDPVARTDQASTSRLWSTTQMFQLATTTSSTMDRMDPTALKDQEDRPVYLVRLVALEAKIQDTFFGEDQVDQVDLEALEALEDQGELEDLDGVDQVDQEDKEDQVAQEGQEEHQEARAAHWDLQDLDIHGTTHTATRSLDTSSGVRLAHEDLMAAVQDRSDQAVASRGTVPVAPLLTTTSSSLMTRVTQLDPMVRMALVAAMILAGHATQGTVPMDMATTSSTMAHKGTMVPTIHGDLVAHTDPGGRLLRPLSTSTE
jgi:hypothetical protein